MKTNDSVILLVYADDINHIIPRYKNAFYRGKPRKINWTPKIHLSTEWIEQDRYQTSPKSETEGRIKEWKAYGYSCATVSTSRFQKKSSDF
jgi:hypothetical protein